MTVAHSTSSSSHSSGSFSVSQASFSWTHTESTDPQYILVMVFQGVASADAATSVTYDGTTIPALSGGRAADTATEPGSVEIFFLGSGCPTTNNPTVVVNRTNNTTTMWAVCVTGTAATDTEVVGTVLLQENGTFAVQSVDDGSASGTDSVRYAGAYYGGASPAPAGTGSTLLDSNDAGAYGWSAVRETTAGQGARNVGFTQATSDDRAGVHFAVRELVVAVKFEGVHSSTGVTSAGDSDGDLTIACTVPADANLAIICWGIGAASGDGGGTVNAITAMTFNGVACTDSGIVLHENNATNGFLEIWYIENPTDGDLVVTSPASGLDILCNVVYYSNAGTPTGFSTATGTASPYTINETAQTDGIAAALIGAGAPFAQGAGTFNRTKRFGVDLNSNSAGGNIGYQDMQGTGSAAALSLTTGSPDWWGIISFEIPLAAGGQSAALATATSTDSAQAIGRISTLAFPKATETDSAQALTRVKKYAALTIATETDSAIAIAARTKKLLSPVAQETDSARQVHYPVKVPTSNETDAAQAIARLKKKTVLIAAETDTAIALTRTKKLVVPVSQETDSAQVFGRVSMLALPIATEADAAQALARRHTKLLPLASETDTARIVTQLTGFQTALETDAAIGISAISILAIQTALATDAARPLATLRSRTVTVATTTDSAQTIAARSVRLLPTSTETDSAQALGRISRLALPTSFETDLARILAATSIKAVPLATESDAAQELGRISSRLIPVAIETDLARLVAGKKILLLPTATELDEARTIANGPLVFIDISVEVGPSRSRALVIVVDASRHDWTVDDSRKSVDVGESRDRPSTVVGESRDRSMLDVGATRPSWEVGDSRHSTEVGESRQERG